MMQWLKEWNNNQKNTPLERVAIYTLFLVISIPVLVVMWPVVIGLIIYEWQDDFKQWWDNFKQRKKRA